MTAAAWADTLENNLEVIDREAALLSFIILPSNFPSFPASSIFKAKNFVNIIFAKFYLYII
jgi:hypothetical protein